jgi:two-component system chemotaxis sensor kinase CheA
MGREDFMRELRATFRVEAVEHLHAIAAGLAELEKLEPNRRAPVIEAVFRAAHSLKGAARAVDFSEIEGLCQALETLFAAWKRGASSPTRESLDATHASLDRIHRALGRDSAATSAAPGPPQAATRVPTSPAAAPPSEPETVRVAVRALDDRLIEAEELLAAKVAAAQRTRELDALLPQFESWHKQWQQSGGATSSFAEWAQDWLRNLEARVSALRRAAARDQLHVEKLVDNLLENSKKLLMLPAGTLTPLIRKVVRDLARELGKDTELAIRGEEIRVDKRILEEMKDPLVHLLRNALDHGIEPPARRVAAGKPGRATIEVAISRINGSQIEIAVRDDGAGIDVPRVRERAVARGLLSPTAAGELDDEGVRALVFETDLSTSPMITELSGRGLGLAIVREKAEKLGGRVGLRSAAGAGTTVRVTLPSTMATFRGVRLECAQRAFVVPTAQVERVTRFRGGDVHTIEGRESLTHDGRPLPLAELAGVLGLPGPRVAMNGAARPALVLGSGNERVAFAVDAIHDECEVLVKRLRKPLVRLRHFAGATVLPSGQVAPILDVAALLKGARKVRPRPTAATPAAAQKSKRALVAEDSITSRMLIKGILESAGYEVKTAVDGLEAFSLLRSEPFDVLVSDIEMPRLNGFDLCTRVRADRTLAELPVILVTALAAREDRERGIDVGANAYLIKSELDQSDLLATVRRLA